MAGAPNLERVLKMSETSSQPPQPLPPVVRPRWHTWLKRAAITIVAVAVIGFLILPPLLRYGGERVLTDVLGRPTTIAEIRINPFSLVFEARGMRIEEPSGGEEALGFERLLIDLEAQSLFRLAPVLRELRLDGPRVNVVRRADGRLNWSDLLDRPASADEGPPPRFAINNIMIEGGAIKVRDEVAGVSHVIDSLHIGLPQVSNLASQIEQFVEPSIAAQVNGQPFALSGRTRPFADDRETHFDITLDAFDFKPLLAYLPFEPAFSVPAGSLSTRLALRFAQPGDADPLVSLSGSATLDQLAVHDAAGAPVLALERLELELADVRPLAGVFRLQKVAIVDPVVDLALLADGKLNLQALLPGSQDGGAAQQGATTPGEAPEQTADSATGPAPASVAPEGQTAGQAAPEFALAEFRIENGTLRFEDRRGDTPFRSQLQAIALQLENVGNAPGVPMRLALSLASEHGERITVLDEAMLLTPLKLAGQLQAEGLQPAKYGHYIRPFLPGGALRDGRLDIALQYRIDDQGAPDAQTGTTSPKVELDVERATLTGFALGLDGRDSPALEIGTLGLTALALRPEARTVTIASVVSSKGALAAMRDRKGRIDLLDLLETAPAAKPAAKAGTAGTTGAKPGANPPKTGQRPQAKGKEEARASAEEGWVIGVELLQLDDWAVRFEDRSGDKPAVLAANRINLKVKDWKSTPGNRLAIELDARINERGRLTVGGSAVPSPLTGDLKLDLKDIDLVPLQSLLPAQPVTVTRGRFSTRGRVVLESARDGSLGGRFQGDLGVSNFALVDRRNADDLARWQSLEIRRSDVTLAPLAVKVDEIALSDFFTRLVLNEEGRLNLSDLGSAKDGVGATAQVAAEAPSVAEPSPLPPVAIGRVVLKGGNIAFSDRFIKPNYNADLQGMEGTLAGISTNADSAADLELRGRAPGASTVSISGRLNPFHQDRQFDVAASVKDFELTSVSAYSGKYVGYGIQKGKLSADLHYKIEDRTLVATNRVFLDQLTFGEKVESPDALDLPVQLAVSLLQNRRGEIDLQVPISGTLDDPQFSVGGLVAQALFNLIGKAITAPFALLGSMLGGGEELSYLDFAAGDASLDEAATERLAALASALVDRPALKLDITGQADPASDIEGLKRREIERQMKAQMLKATLARGQEAPSLDTVVLDPAERTRWLEEVYGDADFKRPRNAIGMLKSLPAPEMEAMLLENTRLAPDALAQLAQARADVVRHYLVEQGGVDASRIFVLGAGAGTPPMPGGDAAQTQGDGESDAAAPGAGRRSLFTLR